MLATLTEAPPVLAAPLAEVVEELPLDFEVAGEAAGVVAVGVVAGVVVAGVVADEVVDVLAPETELAGVLAPEVDEMLPVLVKQALLLPALTVKGADSAVVPVLSRMVRPIEVPAAILVLHVREVPDC